MRIISTLIFAISFIAIAGCDIEKQDQKLAEGPSKIVHLTKENYEGIVNQDDQVVLIDFWAPWCGPCLKLGPTIEQLAYDYDGVVTVCKVNTDKDKELANQFKVGPIPAVFIVKNGKVVGEPIVGMRGIEAYQDRLDKAIAE